MLIAVGKDDDVTGGKPRRRSANEPAQHSPPVMAWYEIRCSDAGMMRAAMVDAGGVSAAHGEVVSTWKKTAPVSLTARRTPDSGSLLMLASGTIGGTLDAVLSSLRWTPADSSSAANSKRGRAADT